MNKKRTLIQAALVLLTIPISFANGQQNSLNIDGPLEIQAGQLVRLNAEIAPEESPFWIVLNPSDLDYEQVDQGRRLIFSVGCQPTREVVVLLLAQQVIDGRIVTRQLRRRMKVEDFRGGPLPNPIDPNPIADPKPTPDPNPTPKPNPDPSPDLTKLRIYAAVADAWKNILNPTAQAKSPQIADRFDAIAELCDEGRIATPRDVWVTLSSENAKVLGSLIRDWDPVGRAMQTEFRNLNLTTSKQHAIYLRAAAAGLRKAASND